MKVLVSAASRHGATGEIAAALAAAIEREGITVLTAAPEEVTDLDGIDAVVLGSGIYAGRWLGSVRHLVERLGPALAARPVWLFSSGPVGDPPQPEGDPAEAASLVEASGAREHRVFAGRLDRRQLNLGERAIVKVVRAADGDFRDWDAIRQWGTEIAAVLREEPAAP